MVGIWNMLPEVVVEADTIGVFKTLLGGHMNIQGMDLIQAEEIHLPWHRVQHWHYGLNDLFLCCTDYESEIFENKYWNVKIKALPANQPAQALTVKKPCSRALDKPRLMKVAKK